MSDKKHTLDTSTIASNPSKVTFKPLVWLRHDTKNAATYFLLLTASLCLCVFHSFYWLPTVCLTLWANWYYWVRVSEHYTSDSNLGVVISEQPALLAVYTDLRKYQGDSYPVLKVIEIKLNRQVRFGEELGTASVYASQDDDESMLGSDYELDYWVNFYPLPIDYATNDRVEIERELRSYPLAQKALILAAVEQLPKPYQAGLFKVNIQNSNWKNIDNTAQ